jgi:hypothetical protein
VTCLYTESYESSCAFWKEEKSAAATKGTDKYWNRKTVTQLWDAIWVDLPHHLLTVTEMGDGKPDSTHRTRSSAFTYRTCHDKLLVVDCLNLRYIVF